MQKIIPVIKPENRMKLLWDFLIIFLTFFLFFVYPIQMSFLFNTYLIDEWVNDSKSLKNAIEIMFAILFGADIMLKLITAYYEKGLLILNKKKILNHYIKEGIFYDLISYLPLLFRMILINNTFKDNQDFIRITNLSNILFILKIVEVNKISRLLEEIVDFGDKAIAFFHLFKLTISIFFFSHIMACLWHAISYYSPYESNLLKFSGFFFKDWTSRYLRCLFITINPGKVDPQNNLELGFAYFALLATSGSIGFMISSIQNITRTFNKAEEAKM